MSNFKSSNLTLIHGIRGVCSVIVVFCHAKFFFWVGGNEYLRQNPRSEWNVLDYIFFGMDMSTSNGTAMVVMFFVLSGFFIAYTCRRNYWKPLAFYRIRFLRVYIPFLGSLLFASLIFYFTILYNPISVPSVDAAGLIERTRATFNFETFFRTFFFVRNEDGLYMAMNFPYWSLFHEAIFYLLAPFLLMRLRFSFGISLLLYVAGFFIKQDNMVLDFFFHYFFYFNVGMLFYDLIAEKSLFSARQFYWLFIFGIFGIALFSNHLIGERLSFLFAAITALLAMHQIIYSNVKEFFVLNFLRYLGNISYTLYLFHIPLFLLILFSTQKAGITYDFFDRYYYLAALLTLLLSIPFYKLIEEPSIKYIQRFRGKKRRTPGVIEEQINPDSVVVIDLKKQCSIRAFFIKS